VTVIKASSVLREGAEAAITQVNNETITAIADWRDTTVIHNETDGGLDLRPRLQDMSTMTLGLASASPVKTKLQRFQHLHAKKSTSWIFLKKYIMINFTKVFIKKVLIF
jgi:hypothetical protein